VRVLLAMRQMVILTAGPAPTAGPAQRTREQVDATEADHGGGGVGVVVSGVAAVVVVVVVVKLKLVLMV
jgi:hypothetical protein